MSRGQPSDVLSKRQGIRRPESLPSNIGALLALPLLATLAAAVVRVRFAVGRLVDVGANFVDPKVRPSVPVHGGAGFDGQFYYRSAIAPLSTRRFEAGIRMDAPALRSARILYSLLARAIGWSPAGVPLGLVVTNAVLAVALGIGVWRLCRTMGGSAAWIPATIAIFPGFVYTITLDLTELLLAVLIVHALAERRSRSRGAHMRSLVLLSLAVFARETSIVFILGALLADLLADRPQDRTWVQRCRGVVCTSVPLLLWIGWQSFIRLRYGSWSFLSASDSNVTRPFAGMAASWRRYWPPTSADSILRILSAGLLAGALVWGAVLLARNLTGVRRLLVDCGDVVVPFVIGSALFAFLNSMSWDGATSLLRHGTEFWIAAAVWIPMALTRSSPITAGGPGSRLPGSEAGPARFVIPLALLAVAAVFCLNAAAQLSKIGSII